MSLRSPMAARRQVSGSLGNGLAAATTSWWLAGGISPANAVVAYAAKGAASQAASYTNLANPGTYDAQVGVAPSWASGTGWTFNGTTQYLRVLLLPQSGWSMIVRFSGFSGSGIAVGGQDTLTNTARFYLSPYLGALGAQVYGYGNSFYSGGALLASGTMAITAALAYRNGAYIGTGGGTYTNGNAVNVAIGGRWTGSAVDNLSSVSIQALAIYNATVTSGQIAALHTAMLAL